MRKLFVIEDTVANKISYYHLLSFLALLPFDFFYSQLVLISLSLHTAIHCTKGRLRLIFTGPFLLLSALFLLGLAATCYGLDKAEAFNITGRQVTLLLIPLLLVLNGLDLERYKMNLLLLFACTCVFVILYLYADAIRIIIYFHLPFSSIFQTVFINHNFSAPVEMHATYLSMYVALSITVFLYLLFSAPTFRQRLFYIAGLLVLSAGLIQLSSRAVVIALLIIVNVAFPFFMPKGKKRSLFTLVATFLSLSFLVFVIAVGSLKMRYIGELRNDLTQSSVNNEVLEPRIVRWKLALELAKRSPLVGYGGGAEKEMLKQVYFQNKLYISYLNEFNTHSQYISFLLRTGSIGLLLYLYTLFFGFSLAIRKRDFLFLGFMVMITIVSVSENLLSVNKGIFFYSFFMSLFVISNCSEIFYKRQPAGAG